jgi:hypothetical protein
MMTESLFQLWLFRDNKKLTGPLIPPEIKKMDPFFIL